jgi:hydrogenase maturation factor
MNREQMIARQQALINAARSGRRDLTADETAEFDELQRQIDALDAAGTAAPAAASTAAPAADAAAGTTRSAAQETAGASHDDMARAIEEERGRIREITSLCREFGMDPGDYIERGTRIDEVRYYERIPGSIS